MILLDSFGWIEYLVDGPLANKYEIYFKDIHQIITPTIVLYEVYKKVKKERNEEDILLIMAQMQKTKIVVLTEEITIKSAEISLTYKLPLADSIIYATAKIEGVPLVTSDPHLEKLDGVKFIKT